MTNRNTILNELAGLGSSLNDHHPQNVYTVPVGYFEGLADQILNRIKALEAIDANDELNYLSPLLSDISKETPYSIPAGFFQNLSDDVLKRISENENHQTSREEIEALSPILGRLKNKNPYSVPAGYFETLEPKVEEKEAKVISITSRKWYRVAVAAIIIGIVVISGLVILRSKQVDPKKDPGGWVYKNVIKKGTTEKIDEFVSLANNDNNEKLDAESEAAKKAEIKELMKDVPEKEIEAFLNDAVALESINDTDGSMNE